MNVNDFIAKIEEMHFSLAVEKGKLILKGNKQKLGNERVNEIRGNVEIINYIKENKQDLIEYVLSAKKYRPGEEGLLPAVTVQERPERIPLSYGQERLWFIDEMEGSVQYHMPAVFRLKGRLGREALEGALQAIVNRHEVLRTVIREHDGVAYQEVLEKGSWKMGYTGIGQVREAAMEQYIGELIAAPFDLGRDHPLRAELIGLTEEEHILVMVLHHIASDDWSMGILIRELVELYRAYTEAREAVLPALRLQYADYALWQRQYVSGELLEEKLGYWKKQLAGVTALELPTDRNRPAVQSYRGEMKGYPLGKELRDGLQALSVREGVTLYMTLLTAFKVLLYRYSGQEDICVGTPIAGRTQQEMERLVGFFINTVALRSEVKGEKSFKELLGQVMETTLAAHEHQEAPLGKVVEAVVTERDLSRSPLFQVSFVWQNMPKVPDLRIGGLELSLVETGHRTSQSELSFYLREDASGISLNIVYNTDLYREETIGRLAGHYTELLRSVVADAGVAVGRLGMLTAGEERQLIKEFNDTGVTSAGDQTVVHLFEAQARRTPETVAVVCAGQELTYGELNARSNQLAHYLRDKGVGPEVLVGVCTERTVEMIVGILGILKAGGAYVPIDPGYPLERIRYLVEDSGLRVVVSVKRYEGLFGVPGPAELVLLDTEKVEIGACSADNPAADLRPEHPAYMIYTSGSTGRPKGVMIGHGSIVDYLQGIEDRIGLEQYGSYAMVSTISADLGNTVLYGSLTSGGTLHVLSEEMVKDGRLLRAYCKSNEIRCIKIVPSHWKALSEEGMDLMAGGMVIFGGEMLREELVGELREKGKGCRIINHYGPTETTIGKLLYEVTGQEGEMSGRVPIGRPFGNTRVYVLDRNGGLCPIGVEGEICIGGAGVALGYWGKAELTAEKFVADPYGETGSRMYRTGDVGRWREDGNMEFIGRRDEQVKVRGFRVELGEIETVLGQHPGIRQAVVVMREDGQGQKRLVGYVMVDGQLGKEGIEAYLQDRLPEHMIPRQWVKLEAVPLTANGKVDRKALPAPDASGMQVKGYEAPGDATEETLAAIWQEVLGVERVGINDNFFELGGDSIMVIQVVIRSRRAGYEFQPRLLFQYQTIAGLSAALANAQERPGPTGEQGMLTGAVGLLPIQRWFLAIEEQVEYDHHYNQSVLLSIDKGIGEAELQAAVEQLIMQHDSWRLGYRRTAEGWLQEYREGKGKLWMEDLRDVSPEQLAGRITAVCRRYQVSLSIEKGEVVRIVWMQTPGSEEHNRLFVVAHHLVMDGVSWRIVLEDLEQLLKGATPGSKSSSYRQWAVALEGYGESRRAQSQLGYWQEVVSTGRRLQETLIDGVRAKLSQLGVLMAKLPIGLTRQLLQEMPRVYHTEINDILLSALAMTLLEGKKTEGVVIGLDGHGRENGIAEGIDTSRTVGWFTSLYPVLLKTEGGKGPEAWLKSVKEQLRQVPDKGLSYGVLKYLRNEVSLAGDDPWEIKYNYLGQFDDVVRSGSVLSRAPEPGGEQVSEEYWVRERLAVNSHVSDGELVVQWSYSRRDYDEETIRGLADTYIRHLTMLVDHCMAQPPGQTHYTPSDFGLGREIGWEELDGFLEEQAGCRRRADQLEGLYRLSGLQEGMLFHGLYDEQVGAYNIQLECELEGLDLEIFSQSWAEVLRRHTVLRSGFYYDRFRIPVQCVYKAVSLPLEVLDYRQLEEVQQQAMISAYREADRLRGFAFETAPLLRVALFRLADDRYRMLWSRHHILFDGWSTAVVMEELLKIYEQLLSGGEVEQEEADRYEEYIRYLEGRDAGADETYWREYLSGIESGSLLPFIESTVERNKGIGQYRTEVLRLDRKATGRLETYAQQNRITVSTVMQGVWSYLLHRYTGRDEVTFGVTVSGRPAELSGVEKRVGLYINALPLRTVLRGEQPVAEWLGELQAGQVASREHQYTALSSISQWLGLGGQDLFDSLLIFENYPVDKVLREGGENRKLQVSGMEGQEQTNYPLSITIDQGEEIKLQFSYNAALLDEATMVRIAGHFDLVLGQLAAGEELTVGDLELLTTKERELLQSFNATGIDYAREKTVVHLFEEQAARTPAEIAVVCGQRQLSYRELDERSNQMGHYLRGLGVKEETLVGICMERGLEMVISILGILKAGGAYVPIDPDYPSERIEYMLSDSGAQIVLRTGDTDWPTISACPSTRPDRQLRPDHLAYVLYTSGSTGRPKGVMIEHGNLSNFMVGMNRSLELEQQDHLLAITSISFDISFLELWWTLCRGMRVTMMPAEGGLTGFDAFVRGTQKVEMDFGLFYFSSGKGEGEGIYDFLMRSVELADQHDFTSVWLPERHFHEFGGIFSSPSVLAGALATKTKQIEIRAGSVVLPLNDVLRVAETWSVVDNLSNGRVALSVASGWHADDFALMPGNYKDRHAIMYRQIEELRSLWKGEAVSRKNGYDKEIDIKIYPRPVRPQLPVWITSAGSKETFRSAGRIGANVLTHMLSQRIEVLAENIRAYKQALQENGHSVADARIAVMLHTYIGKEEAEVKEVVKEPFKSYLRSSIDLLKNLAKDAGAGEVDLAEENIEELLDMIFERYWQSSALLGTPESCRPLIEKLSAIGVTEVACLIDFGVDATKVIDHLEDLNEFRKMFVRGEDRSSMTGKGVSALQITPSYVQALLDDEGSQEFLRGLRHIIVGGERLGGEVKERLLRVSGAKVYNVYGPTETTIWSTAGRMEAGREVNIGRPISNTQIHIEDKEGRLCGVGITGEIWIGGQGVSRGYWGRPELTAERFVPNPHGEGRRYRTGDLGRWLPDGNIEYAGRIDEQVKIRGHRIEPGEIEAVLMESGLVKQGVVVVREESPGDRRLIGYVVTEGAFDQEALQAYLRRRLPEYMVPSVLMEMDQLPLTLNGKLDRRALPEPDRETSSEPYLAPRNEMEQQLAAIWQAVLKLEQVGIHNNFFELGGHSLLAMGVVSAVRRQLGKELRVRDLFRNPTVAGLAAHLQEPEKKTYKSRLII